MPCEVIPCIVNNTYIVVEPRVNKLGSTSTMHETKAKVEQDNKMVWTNTDLQGGTRADKGVSSYGRAPEGHFNMLQNDLKFRDIDYRVLPRAFSTLGNFGVVTEESEPATSDHLGETSHWFSRSRIRDCETPRRYSTSSWPSDTFFREHQRSREFSAHKNNRRRQSEGFIISGTKVFGLVGYKNESGDQRSDNHYLNGKLAKRERYSESHKTSHNISLASFDIMSSVATALDQPKGYHSLPRRLSHPIQSFGNDHDFNTMSKNGKQQRNSLPTDGCLQEYHFDNDTELQWQRLVARAKTLQLASARRPEIVRSQLTDNNSEQVPQKATKSAGADSLSKERRIYEVKCIDKENNNQPGITRRRRRTEERRYSLKMIPSGVVSSSESQTKKDTDDKLTETEMTHPAQGHDTVVVSEQRCVVSPIDNTNRRHSVAVVRPAQEVKERVSGYSTHGALEYAKMLMGKIQEEGKTKSKKERLDEMSKVLKLVLEELNRIELPDRDLVSLFISLRAKMVNLRTELKADEGEKDVEVEKEIGKKNEKKFLSNSLPRPSSHEDDTPAHSRRFSWI